MLISLCIIHHGIWCGTHRGEQFVVPGRTCQTHRTWTEQSGTCIFPSLACGSGGADPAPGYQGWVYARIVFHHHWCSIWTRYGNMTQIDFVRLNLGLLLELLGVVQLLECKSLDFSIIWADKISSLLKLSWVAFLSFAT